MSKDTISPGTVIAGKYHVERKLGEGGMGAVFVAQNQVLNQRTVVKVLHERAGKDERTVARFLREARAAAKIQNEHVARVLDFGTLDDGAPYLVMEYLEGCDLEQELQARGPLPIGEAVDRVVQALDGLAVAHEVGIVHRDIKPANLFLAARQGGGLVVKILDFGIAKSDDGPSEVALTATSNMLGSPLYMSPEQLRSAKYVEARSDLWAVGVVLYQLLTGLTPFNGEGLGDLVFAIMSKTPTPPSEMRREIPAPLEQIILACLSKDPAGRPANARALADALVPFAGTLSSPHVVVAQRTSPAPSDDLAPTFDLASAEALAPTHALAAYAAPLRDQPQLVVLGAQTEDALALTAHATPTGRGGWRTIVGYGALVVVLGGTLAVGASWGSTRATDQGNVAATAPQAVPSALPIDAGLRPRGVSRD